MSTPRRCVLVGSDSLLVQCAQILEQASFPIVAVVTDRNTVAQWANEKKYRVFKHAASLLTEPDLGPFEYLFSVTNLSVLPAEVLALPTRAAINFHDGPLPDYAGLNTPIWAMLNGETRHGITWHLMTANVDQGDILTERKFDIAADETALTLNTKCFEAGFEGFKDLVTMLADGELKRTPQSGPIRKYFGRKDRPAGAGAVAWDQPAERIARTVRALDFGGYANPLGSPKVRHNGRLFVVSQIELLTSQAGAKPGTILSVDAAGVTVATADRDLRITRFDTLDGKPLTPAEAATQFGLRAGGSFDVLGTTELADLSMINEKVGRHEGFWQGRLGSLEALNLPQVDRTAPPATPRYEHSDLTLPEIANGAEPTTNAVAALVGVLARLADKDAFDLGYGDPGLTTLVGRSHDWFANHVPFRVALDFSKSFAALRDCVVAEQKEVRRRGTYATDLLARVPEFRAVPNPNDLRDLPVALVIVDRLDDATAWPGHELTVAIQADGAASRWIYDTVKLSPADVAKLQASLAEFASAAAGDASRAIADLPLLPPAEWNRAVFEWNDTAGANPDHECIHTQFEAQAAKTPDRPAVTCGGRTLTYAELNTRANRLARRLASMGVRPDVLVGLMCDRSVELIVGLVAIHKAGGAYVPLDPTYPRDRLAHMIDDAKVTVLLTKEHLLGDLPRHDASVVCLDRDWPSIETESAESFDGGANPEHLAYVIYTSGSTGKPKGVMVEHRNVVNFFTGMDRHLGDDGPGTWLAVTSLSFDISVLELCWTLARGFHVVVSTDEDRTAATVARPASANRPLDFSLFYFSSDESEGTADKYRLLLEGAKYGDENGFKAVWTPERHFHAFGGLYPNPAVTGAALAAITKNVQIRAGSVVLPLHHPLRVAEEWSVVDNISRGRVGISFASGWQPDDFVLRPQNYADNKNVMFRDIDVVRRLWRGEKVPFENGLGKHVPTQTLPRPVQKELPYWVTSAGNPETFAAAGRIGANVLTHLLGQTVSELKDKLAVYRKAWKEAGHAGEGYVSLMLHAFVGPDPAYVRETVKQPLIEYLRSSLNLVKQYAWTFPAFKRREGMDTSAASLDLTGLSKEEMDGLLEFSFERYFETSGLFGTPEQCVAMIDAIKAVGVDDVACLIDFGVDSSTVLKHLPYLNELRIRSLPAEAKPSAVVTPDAPISELLTRHRVSHFQCTPSMARMLLADDAAKPGLAGLTCMMVGGEAMPPAVAKELKGLIKGRLMNMYGPTETTIWSSVETVGAVDGPIPLGRPLANQQIYILDRRQRPVPIGVPGELVIGGKGVVRGYLHRPELTADRFLPTPFPAPAAGRVYRTGDLARHRPDGTVEYLGRLDHQVKVRGYRIELGEIETALVALGEIRNAVVVAREDIPGDVRIVAYVVASCGAVPTVTDVRERLRATLPDFMLPANLVVMPALPLTPNGKIDRKALPAPDVASPAKAAVTYTAPASDLEEKITGVWKDVLKLPQVGTKDNFFDLGGHSLLAMQALRSLKKELGRDLTITDIFRFPTIQSLSGYLSREDGDDASIQAGKQRAQGRRAAFQRR